jgi:nucleotide-binding universal stress UspA family protein
MKTILIPFDFSESAHTALTYAIGLSRYIKASFTLLTVNSYPVATPEVGLSSFSYVNAKEDCLKELQKVASAVKAANSELTIDCYSEIGEVTDEIRKLSEKLEIELIVMGISGHGNSFIRTLAGSSAVAVSKHSRLPVIIVPPEYHFSKPARVAFACKYGDETSHPDTLEKVKEFCRHFAADLHLVHLVKEGQPIQHTEAIVDNYLEHRVEESVHRTFIMTEKKIAEGLMAMLKNNLLDMIVVEPKKHNFFENLFHQSVTTELAFNSPVPVMAVHSDF